MKKITILLFLSVVFFTLTSCTDYEANVINGIKESLQSTSFESDWQISWDLELEGTREDQNSLRHMIRMINGVSLTINEKYYAEEKGEKEQRQVTLGLDSKWLDNDMIVWLDLNKQEETPVIRSIVSLPEKDYVIFDVNHFMTEEEVDVSFIENPELLLNEWQTMLSKWLIEYCLTYDFDGTTIDYLGEEIVGDQKVDVYKVMMTNEEVKQWLNYSLEHILENEMWASIIEALSEEDFEGDVLKWFEAVEIIGDDGLEMVFKIDASNHLLFYEGHIDLIFSVEDYSAIVDLFFDEVQLSSEARFMMTLYFEMKAEHYNEQVLITLPELTEENSKYFSEMEW